MPYIHSDCCDAPAGIYHSTSDPVAILSSRAGFVEKTETALLINNIAVHQVNYSVSLCAGVQIQRQEG